jgi:lysophospholipase L1-like esterase
MSVPRFGAAAVGQHGVFEENYTRRGKHTYHVNAFGFRGPEWNLVKQPATVRGIVIGDSMVFGSGVDKADAIDSALANRLRRAHAGTSVEVLNLGVPGSNLPNYVELYRAAEERLMPDFVVVFLFLPNDLGELEQPSQEDRFGAYSFFKLLLGTNNNPYTFYAMRNSELRSDDSQLAFLADHMDAIERLRRSPLFVFLYHKDDPRWADTVETHLGAGAWVVDHPPLPAPDFIPDDGHPTPAGNRHFAEIIGDAIDHSPAASSLFGGA